MWNVWVGFTSVSVCVCVCTEHEQNELIRFSGFNWQMFVHWSRNWNIFSNFVCKCNFVFERYIQIFCTLHRELLILLFFLQSVVCVVVVWMGDDISFNSIASFRFLLCLCVPFPHVHFVSPLNDNKELSIKMEVNNVMPFLC